MSKRKCWRYSVGDRGNRVTVYEREPGGPLYARAFDRKLRKGKGGMRRESLGHRDRPEAKKYADTQHGKLVEGRSDLLAGRVTLSRLMAEYLRHRTPRKGTSEQKEDQRRAQLWTRVLGSDKDPHKITLGEWERFLDSRSSGSLDSFGRSVPEERRRTVRVRTVQSDLQWLRWLLNWGTKWRDHEGRYLLRENPVRGYDMPAEKNPRRPVVSQDRYQVLRAVSDTVTMRTRWRGQERQHRSYLSELLDIVNGTGRRLSAVCQLSYENLLLDRGPHGSIRWPADTDKMGRESVVFVSPGVKAAVDRIRRERPGIGPTPLFPSLDDLTRPIDRYLADRWLRKAEKLAGLDSQAGSLWHAFRRKWATERKHLPDVDVAAAGGWKGTMRLKRAYQHADPETMLRVVLEAGELREAR